MDRSYETWADSFHFSDDLKVLEDAYQEQHRETLTHQEEASLKDASAEQSQQPASEIEDEAFLNQLSDYLACRLKEQLYAPEMVQQYLKLSELEEDNRLMAQQIESLVQALETKNRELEVLRQQKDDYRHLFWNVHLKIDE